MRPGATWVLWRRSLASDSGTDPRPEVSLLDGRIAIVSTQDRYRVRAILNTCRIARVAGTTLLKEQTMKRHSLLTAAVASVGILFAGAANAATGFSGQADGMAPHAADRTGSSRTSSGPAAGGPLRSADGWVFVGEAGWVFDGRGLPGAASRAAIEPRQMTRPTVNHGTSGSAIDGIYVGA